MARTLSVGESLVGDGNEVAHIDLLIGSKDDSVRDGVIPEGEVDDLCIIVGVFIHWLAEDDKKIFDWNYQATKESIARAMAGEPAVGTVIEQEAEARHPFAAGAEA